MNITNIQIRQIYETGKMKAVVSITIDNAFAVHDIKIIDGKKGRFISMPARPNLGGGFRDIVHPINSVIRKELEDLILKKYDEMMMAEEYPNGSRLKTEKGSQDHTSKM